MKVHELIEQLKKCGQNRIVIMSADGEGNDFSPIANLEDVIYVPQTTWHGETYLEELTAELADSGFCDEDLYHGDKGQKAVILWPVG